MKRLAITTTLLLALGGCGDDDTPPPRGDAGFPPGSDAGPRPDGAPPLMDSGGPGRDSGGVCVPSVEICGDRMDQNCDGRDTSCGDTDMDGVQACRPGDDLTRCDCDDSTMAVRPPVGSLPGAQEACDGMDNDCNGRIDESAACCEGCASLGTARDRADLCTTEGVCVCSTGSGTEPCPVGQTCCSGGCVDVQTDIMNCGLCGAVCTNQSDNCAAGNCRCGSGPPCDLDRMCSGGC